MHRDKAQLTEEDAAMARCYFHLVRGGVTLPDHEGVEIPDAEWKREITNIIGEISAEEPELFEGTGGWTIQVVDEEGREVARYPL
jgi:Domain of unknown function (DUF6894)